MCYPIIIKRKRGKNKEIYNIIKKILMRDIFKIKDSLYIYTKYSHAIITGVTRRPRVV